MSTLIYGTGDDNVEVEGDVEGEYGYSDTDEGTLFFCSDGTILQIKYGKEDIEDGGALWEIKVKAKGTLYSRMEICEEETNDGYSDKVYFSKGLRWVYAAKDWERIS